MAAITTANGANATKRAAIIAGTTTLSDFIDGSDEWGTKLRVCYDTYTMSGNTAVAGWVLTIGFVPKGARVLGFYVGNSANSAATTADLQLVDSDGNITTATTAEAWTSWNAAAHLFIPALESVADGVLDEGHFVTVTTAAQTVADGTSVTVATLYLAPD